MISLYIAKEKRVYWKQRSLNGIIKKIQKIIRDRQTDDETAYQFVIVS